MFRVSSFFKQSFRESCVSLKDLKMIGKFYITIFNFILVF